MERFRDQHQGLPFEHPSRDSRSSYLYVTTFNPQGNGAPEHVQSALCPSPDKVVHKPEPKLSPELQESKVIS